MRQEDYYPFNLAAWFAVVCIVLALATYGCRRPDPNKTALRPPHAPDLREAVEDAAGVAGRLQGHADAILGHAGTVRREVASVPAVAAKVAPAVAGLDREATGVAGEAVRLEALGSDLDAAHAAVCLLEEQLGAAIERADKAESSLRGERLGWVKTAGAVLGLAGVAIGALGLLAAIGAGQRQGWAFGVAGGVLAACAIALAALAEAVAVMLFWLRLGVALACAAGIAYGGYYLWQWFRARRALVGVVRSVDAAKAVLGAAGEPQREAVNAALAANQPADVRAAVAEIRGAA